ncbi:hypothetical protein B2G74_33245 [Burkholderia sp. A27]|nr:hypothetical protein B2G74_33245 [Burkholderia sp. A27]
MFGELGGFITQGAAIGMEGEQGRIAKAAIGLATLAATSFAAHGVQAAGTPAGGPGVAIDTRPALQAPPAAGKSAGGASAAGGDTYIFQISGGGADEIETRIRKVLADIERKKASRVSSRLSD